MFTLREQSLLTSIVHFHLQKNTTHHLKIKENKRKPYSLKSTDVWTWSLQEHLWLFSVAVASDPMDCSMPGYPVLRLPEFAETHVHQVSDTIQPSHPLSPHLLLPSIFPSIRVFSKESALRINWPKYWSIMFSKEGRRRQNTAVWSAFCRWYLDKIGYSTCTTFKFL